MSANQDGPQLRFEAGKFEDSIITLILALQMTLGAGAAVMLAAVLFMNDGLELLPVVIPAVVSVALIVFLLNCLYE